MRHPARAVFAAAIAATLLAGCGGGGSSSDSASMRTPLATQTAAVSTYVTDNLNTDYSKVWAGVLDITLVGATGQKVVLFHSDTAVVYNLSSLASVASLLSSAIIPQGTYVRALVTLDDKVQLVSLDGKTTLNATIKGDGTPTIMPVELEFTPGAADQLVLDFDLAKFTYDAATNHVVPAVVRSAKKGGDSKDFESTEAKANGVVSNVGVDGLTVTDKYLGENVRVHITSASVIIDDDSGAPVALANVKPGFHVEAKGIIESEHPPVLAATTVRVSAPQATGSAKPAIGPVVGGEGIVSAVTSTSMTVDIKEADFLPGSNQVVVDLSNTKYAHGSLADIKVGRKVEFVGTPVGTTVLAKLVNINGALSAPERAEHPGALGGEIQGTVTSISGSLAQVIVAKAERETDSDSKVAAPQAGTSVQVDLSSAIFERGNLSCVVAGKVIEAAGRLSTNNTLVARVVALEHGCAAPTATTVSTTR